VIAVKKKTVLLSNFSRVVIYLVNWRNIALKYIVIFRSYERFARTEFFLCDCTLFFKLKISSFRILSFMLSDILVICC